jgi:hypothetical protein
MNVAIIGKVPAALLIGFPNGFNDAMNTLD